MNFLIDSLNKFAPIFGGRNLCVVIFADTHTNMEKAYIWRQAHSLKMFPCPFYIFEVSNIQTNKSHSPLLFGNIYNN